MDQSKKFRIFCLSIGVVLLLANNACKHANDGSLLVHEGDEHRSCADLLEEHRKADYLSGENVEARKLWIIQLMRERDCQVPMGVKPSIRFSLTIGG
jgi:hypothetical protein